MQRTPKYQFRMIPFGVVDWCGIINANFQILEDNLHSRFTITAGEYLAINKLIYLKSDGLWYVADGTVAGKRPALAFTRANTAIGTSSVALRRGIATVNTIVPGQLAYLGSSGNITLTKPGSNVQVVGYGIDYGSCFINLDGIII